MYHSYGVTTWGGDTVTAACWSQVYVVKCIKAVDYYYKWKLNFLMKPWHDNIDAISPLFGSQNGSDNIVWHHIKQKEKKMYFHNYVLTTQFEVCLNTESTNKLYVYYPYLIWIIISGSFFIWLLHHWVIVPLGIQHRNRKTHWKIKQVFGLVHVNLEIKHTHVES